MLDGFLMNMLEYHINKSNTLNFTLMFIKLPLAQNLQVTQILH